MSLYLMYVTSQVWIVFIAFLLFGAYGIIPLSAKSNDTARPFAVAIVTNVSAAVVAIVTTPATAVAI